jgi:molybdenum cofactor synthesis domain-containing protein
VARAEEARQRAVGVARQQTAVAEERLRLVQRLEGAVRRQPALSCPPLLELRRHAHILARVARGAIVTIGNELVSGDVENTNGSWLARRLAELGIEVVLIAVLPDEVGQIGAFVREQAEVADIVLVTGGLGGTPDDITREAIAAAFGVGQVEQPEVAARLRARFQRDPEYVARWACLPEGSRALENPLGGAPGFVFGNVYVLPGLPAEMEAMFETIVDELRAGGPIGSWRRTYRTTESRIVAVLEAMSEKHPDVLVGSYPSFRPEGSEVEVVVKSSDPAALASAVAWIQPKLEAVTR